MKIYDSYSLRDAHLAKHPDSHFFGERFSEMRLLKSKATATDGLGEKHLCYLLSSVQRIPMVGRKRVWHCFDVETLEHIKTV